MTPTPKTIQIFLPGGDPRGLRVAEVTTRIVQVIEVPRSLLEDFLKMPESTQVGVYFLLGEAEDDGDPRVYVGQTGGLRQRLPSHNSHNEKKDFWERAVVLVSRTNSLTQTHALFLEWYCLQEASKAGRYVVVNGNGGSKPHTPAPLQADCLEIFDTGSTLLATLGFPVFAESAAAFVSRRLRGDVRRRRSWPSSDATPPLRTKDPGASCRIAALCHRRIKIANAGSTPPRVRFVEFCSACSVAAPWAKAAVAPPDRTRARAHFDSLEVVTRMDLPANVSACSTAGS